MQYVVRHDDAGVPASSPTTEASSSPCIFCQKPAERRDRDNLIVERGPTCFVILNAFPYNNGHLLVVPYRHVNHPALLTATESTEMMATATRMAEILGVISSPDGFNIGMNVGSAAGAGIAAHLHLHVVPRWSGDTNFMPVIGDVKVMPELLTAAWDKLTSAVANGATTRSDADADGESR
jgi:ATP adenylyltransferase